jgi:pimeloyl-ACP methyl ester carboxylesterase
MTQPGGQIHAPTRKRSRRALAVSIAMIGTAVALWLGAASFLTYEILHPPFSASADGDVIVAGDAAKTARKKLRGDPQAQCGAAYEEVRIGYGGGKSAGGWLVPAGNSAAIVLAPPSGASRRAMLPYVQFLHDGGYTAILIDNPEHGSSSWGLGMRAVVASAAAMLRAKGYAQVAALGVSEGAAAVILAQAGGAGLNAIVADSSYANLGSIFRANPTLSGLNPAFLYTVMWELGLALGQSPDAISPEAAAGQLGDCALMLIQNGGDPVTPKAQGEAVFAHANAANREIWIAASDGHGDAIYQAPGEYRARVLAFLAKNMASAAPH